MKITFKTIRYIFEPLIVGAFIGMVAGVGIVLIGRLLSFGYSSKQEALAFFGFTLIWTIVGLKDSIERIIVLKRYKKHVEGKVENSS